MRLTTLITICILGFSQLMYSADADTLKKKKEVKFAKYLELSMENGAILGNDNELSEQIVNSSYYNGLDIRLAFRRTNKNDVYSNVYRRPYTGVGWYASTFHNADVGKPNAIYWFLNFPFTFERDKRLTFSYTAAFGLSYNFNPYDPVKNPTNIFVGSYRNCYVHLGFSMNYQVARNWALYGTLGFKHFSNGSFKQPNYGMNLIPLSIGVRYKVSKAEIDQYEVERPKFIKNNQWNIAFGFGSKNYEVGGENYFKANLSLNYLRQISWKYRLGVGLDIFYSDKAELRNDSDQSMFSKSYSYAVVGSWEWVLNKNLYVPIGIGIYLHRNEGNDEKLPFYQRVGLRYRILDHYFAGLTIKAHAGAADYFEWTIGYTFNKDKNKYTIQ